MLIKTTQIQSLGDAQEERFVHETVARLRVTEPLWVAGKSEGEISVQVEDLVAFAGASRIRKREAVMSIIEAFIRHKPVLPLDERLINVLRQPNVTEAARAEQFYISLASGRHLLQEIALTI